MIPAIDNLGLATIPWLFSATQIYALLRIFDLWPRLPMSIHAYVVAGAGNVMMAWWVWETALWGFLPWTLTFIAANIKLWRDYR